MSSVLCQQTGGLSTAADLKIFPRDSGGQAFLQTCSGKPCIWLQPTVCPPFPCTRASLPTGGAVLLASAAHLLTVHIQGQQCCEAQPLHITSQKSRTMPLQMACFHSVQVAWESHAHTGWRACRDFSSSFGFVLLVRLEGRWPRACIAVQPHVKVGFFCRKSRIKVGWLAGWFYLQPKLGFQLISNLCCHPTVLGALILSS